MRPDPCDLSERERQVLSLMAKGMSNEEIGSSLCISDGTARTHARNIYAKLDASSRTDAVVKAHRLGMVQLPGLSPIAQTILQLLRVQPGALQELIDAGVLERP